LVRIFEAILEAVTIRIGIVGVAFRWIEHSITVEIFYAIGESVAVGVGVGRIRGVSTPHFHAIEESISVAIGL